MVVPMLQALDYVVTGLLLSCAGAIGLTFFFPAVGQSFHGI